MELEEVLAFPLTSLANGIPLSNTQLQKIMDAFPENSQTYSLVKLLHIANQCPNPQFSVADALGEVLKALAGKLKFEEPLRLLTACEFEQFREYCTSIEDKQLARAFQSSLGLYPVAWAGCAWPSSIYMQKGKGNVQGNPHWLHSRAAVKEYFRIKGAKLSEVVKELYLFLLGDEQLLELWKDDALKQLWGQLYIIYTNLVLQPHLQEAQLFGEINQALITWYKPTIQQSLQRLKQIEAALQLEDRLLCFLALAIIAQNEKWSEKMERCPLEAAFDAFLKIYNETCQWQNLMSLLFFSQLAKKGGPAHIVEECSRCFKRLLSVSYNFERLIPFLYFFLDEAELLAIFVVKQIEYWRVPLPEEIKKAAANHLVASGVLQLRSLRYVDTQFFIDNVFKSTLLQNPAEGMPMIAFLDENEAEVLNFLKNFSIAGEDEAQHSYQLFVNTWSDYYRLLQADDLQLADMALTEHGDFHASLQSVLYLPRDSATAVFNILTTMTRVYRSQCQQMQDLSQLLEKMSDFQQNMLPDLIPVLSEEQRGQFWSQWNVVHAVLRMDPLFKPEEMVVE